MRKILVTVLVLAFAAAPAFAQSLNDLATGKGSIEIPAKMSDAEVEQWQKKEQYYAESLNRVNGIKSTMKSYLGWAKEGPNAQAKNIRGINDMGSSLDRIIKAEENNAKVNAKILPIDLVFAEMAAAAKELKEINGEANKYYSRKDYLEDNMAKGAELHPKLIEKYNAFVEAADKMDGMKDELTEKLEPKKLDLIAKKYGKEYYWQHVRLMAKARAVVKFLPENASDTVDGAAYDAAVSDFSATLKEFEDYYTKTGDEGVRKLARMPLNPDAFNSFLASAREVGQDVKAGKKDNSYVNHINSMVRSYNSLIDRSNRTTFLLSK
ncbi:MAG: hypothetical protein DELT_01962 [Desulfovibrio sp.]